MGAVLRETGKVQESMEYFERALRLKPSFPEAHCNLGKALLQAGRPAEAIEHFRQALRLKPDYAEAHAALSDALTATGHVQGGDRAF